MIVRKKREPVLLLGLKTEKSEIFNELVIPVILFGTIGAFYWAVRGTSGYGGTSGAVFAGIGWALCWFFLSYEQHEKKERPYSSGWIVLAIKLGIGIGGMHGYGQFISWIMFRLIPFIFKFIVNKIILNYYFSC